MLSVDLELQTLNRAQVDFNLDFEPLVNFQYRGPSTIVDSRFRCLCGNRIVDQYRVEHLESGQTFTIGRCCIKLFVHNYRSCFHCGILHTLTDVYCDRITCRGGIVLDGPYHSRTYRWILNHDREYCENSVRYQSWSELSQWLIGQGLIDSIDQSGSAIVEFGKYEGLEFQQVLGLDISYCRWALRQIDPDQPLAKLQQWLQRQNIITHNPVQTWPSDKVLSIGKHQGLTFFQIRQRHPDYCRWIMKQKTLVRQELYDFQTWLNEQ